MADLLKLITSFQVFSLIILANFVSTAEFCKIMDSHSAICPGQNYVGIPNGFEQSIQDLNLALNNITQLEVNKLKQYPNVKNLNLDCNQIRSSSSIRTIHVLKKLERLSISGNGFVNFDFQILARNIHLKEIVINNNTHIFIKEKCVLLQKLERLSLNGNGIENFPSVVLKCFPNLLYLDLRNNNLSTLPSNINEILPKLEKILLAGNPIRNEELNEFVLVRSDLNK